MSQNLLLVDGRQILGIVAPGAAGEKVVLTSEGEKMPIPEQDIDEITPSKTSSMPDGLLKELTLAGNRRPVRLRQRGPTANGGSAT